MGPWGRSGSFMAQRGTLNSLQRFETLYQAESTKVNSTVIAIFNISISRFKDEVEDIVRSIWHSP